MPRTPKQKPVPRQVSGKGKPTPGTPEPGTGKPTAPKTVLRMHAEAADEELTHPMWRLSLLDREHNGSWSWEVSAEDLADIVSFLSGMERLTWREIRQQKTPAAHNHSRPKHHAMNIADLCKEAQDRLAELKLDEWDELFRFRFGATGRLWGVLSHDRPRVFYPIWYDAHHKVFPTEHS